MASNDHTAAFGPLEGSKTALLTTFRDGGEAVATPLSIALANGKVYFVTATDSGKARRLDPAERRTAAKGLLKPTGPLFWSLVMYRLFHGRKMELFEVVPAGGPA